MPKSSSKTKTRSAPKTAAPESADDTKAVSEVEELRAELERSQDQHLRLQAEVQNLQRRHQRERETAARYQVEPLARELLEVADAMDEAAQAMDGDEQVPNSVREGQDLILRRLRQALEHCSIAVIDPAGEAFDPQLHEAMLTQPDAEHPPGTVLVVLRKGYRLHDRLLRPARVVVAAAQPEPEPQESETST